MLNLSQSNISLSLLLLHNCIWINAIKNCSSVKVIINEHHSYDRGVSNDIRLQTTCVAIINHGENCFNVANEINTLVVVCAVSSDFPRRQFPYSIFHFPFCIRTLSYVYVSLFFICISESIWTCDQHTKIPTKLLVI